MKAELLGSGLLALAVLGTALALVTAKHESRALFVRSQELLREQDRLGVEWNMLQLEQAAWATHGRIEQVAREKLDMRIPHRGDVTILRY